MGNPKLARLVPKLAAYRYAALTTVLAFAVYLRTLSPTIMWYDRAEFVVGSHVLGIAHNTGYPLYMILGKLFTFLPLGDIAYRVNLMSAVFAALAALLVFLIVRLITQRQFPAFIAGATIAFSSTFWANAIWADAHSLNAFLTLLILYLLVVWREKGDINYLYLAFLTFGLSLGNHRLILVIWPAMLLFLLLGVKGRPFPVRLRPILLPLLFLLVGFSVHLYLPIRAMQDPPVNWGDPARVWDFLDLALLGTGQSGAYDPSPLNMWHRRGILWDFPSYDFTVPGLALAAIGIVWLSRYDRRFLTLTSVPALLTAFVIITYRIHDIYDYFIPISLMVAIWLGIGVHQLTGWLVWMLNRLDGTRLRIIRPTVGRYSLYLLFLALPLSLLLNNFHLLDRSDDYEAYDFAYNTLSSLPPQRSSRRRLVGLLSAAIPAGGKWPAG